MPKLTSLLPDGSILLSEILLLKTIPRITSVTNSSILSSVLCENSGVIGWLILLGVAGIVTTITSLANHCSGQPERQIRIVTTFLCSFLLALCTNGVGDAVIFCSAEIAEMRNSSGTLELPRAVKAYNVATALFYAAMILVFVISFKSRAPRRIQEGKIRVLPPIPILLTGVCVQLTVEKLIPIFDSSTIYEGDFCSNGGLASWALLLANSAVLTVLTLSQRHEANDCMCKGIITCALTFILNFCVGDIGEVAVLCTVSDQYPTLALGEHSGNTNYTVLNDIGESYSSEVEFMFNFGTMSLLGVISLIVPIHYFMRQKDGRSPEDTDFFLSDEST